MAFKFRYWARLTKAFINRFKIILFASIVAGLFLFSFLQVFAPSLFGANVEYIGRSGRFHADELPVDILDLIGEGLTDVDESGTVVPALAESWQSDEEGKIWTFTLNSAKVWHDGTPVVASDINYAFEDATIKVIDDKTIQFELTTTFSPFPVVVSRPVFKRGLLGTGEWRVSGISQNSEFVERLTIQNTKNQKKMYRFYPTEDAMKIAFQLGEIDVITDLLDPYPFADWKTANIFKNINENRFVAVFFNNKADPFVNNKTYRQALSYAVDKKDFNAPRAISPISPKSWAYNSQVKEYEYSVERAKEIIDDIPEEARANLSFSLTTTPVLLTTAEKLANSWKEVGIDVSVNVVSIIPDDYQAFLAIYNIPPDPDQYSMWHSTQSNTNISKFSNPRIDILLEQGRVSKDPEERKKIYLDFQRFLLEESPALFLYHPISYTVVRK